MTLETDASQKTESSVHDGTQQGEALAPTTRERVRSAVQRRQPLGGTALMEAVVAPDNFRAAVKRVQANKGSPGVDKMPVAQLTIWLEANEARLREQLLSARYRPSPVRRHELPKPGGGTRLLGIPTAVDRMVQQALLQVLQPLIDPTFSDHSYGFRPGRSAQQAVGRAHQYVCEGRHWVVDVDLEKFFDRVNHDVLMSRVARCIEDKRVLKVIRAFLEAGIMVQGVVLDSEEGTPQGGPLSPLLANILLDEVDKELESRGHAFVRYADDCNVYVHTEKAAQRVLVSLRKTYARLHLRLNESKSAAAKVWGRRFLGFTFRGSKTAEEPEIGISNKARERFRERVR